MFHTMWKLALVSVFYSIAFGHMCLFNPHQRGSLLGANIVGAPICDLWQNAPCGGMTPESPTIYAEVGSNYSIVIQKNKDHFNGSDPGNFTISFSLSYDIFDFQLLAVVPDTNATSLAVYEVDVALPSMVTEHGIIQVIYNTNTGYVWYQCADIGLYLYSPPNPTTGHSKTSDNPSTSTTGTLPPSVPSLAGWRAAVALLSIGLIVVGAALGFTFYRIRNSRGVSAWTSLLHGDSSKKNGLDLS